MMADNGAREAAWSAGAAHDKIKAYAANFKITKEQADELTWFFDYGRGRGWRNRNWGDALVQKNGEGYSATQISRLWSGSFEGSFDNICSAVHVFMEQTVARQKMSSEDVCVETTVYSTIMENAKLAKARSTPIIITGRTSIGKTFGLEQYRLQNITQVKRFRCRPFSAYEFHQSFAKAVGVTGKHRKEEILDECVRLLGPDKMLIIDEMHELALCSEKNRKIIIENLRYVLDESGCSAVLCGTDKLTHDLFENPVDQDWFKQLIARCLKRVDLDKVLAEEATRIGDIQATLAAYGFTAADDRQMAVLLRITMRQLCHCLKSATAATRNNPKLRRTADLLLATVKDHIGEVKK